MAVSVANTHSQNKVGNCIILALKGKVWQVINNNIKIADEGNVFAPGNMKAAFDNKNYKDLIDLYIDRKYTLRYSGGMVPDVYHILVKGKGVFMSVGSEKSKAKLRLLYELAPIAFLIECCGGVSSTAGKTKQHPEAISMLDVQIEQYEQKAGVI